MQKAPGWAAEASLFGLRRIPIGGGLGQDGAEAAKEGIKDQVEAMDQALLTAEMFVAFSKKSPCTALADKFGQAITEMTTDGSFDAILAKATADWDAAQAKQ